VGVSTSSEGEESITVKLGKERSEGVEEKEEIL